MFTFAICLIILFLFDETSSNPTELQDPSNPTEIQHQNPQRFWHDLLKKNGIWDNEVKQMADEMDESDPFIEKLSKLPPPSSPEHPAFENHNSTPNELKHPVKQSLFFKLFKFGNFYELVGRLGKKAQLVQNLAKTFINIKSLLIKNGQIAITMGQTENAVKLLAKQNEIDYEKAGKSTGVQIELPEIVKRMATIWSEMSHTKNGGENPKEIVEKIVNLWQSAKHNDEFKKYFGSKTTSIKKYFSNKMTKKDKNEGKNRRIKRVGPIIFIFAGILVAFICFLIFVVYVYKNLTKNL